MKTVVSRFIFVILFASCAFYAQAPPAEPPTKSPSLAYGLVVDNSGTYRLMLERVMSLASAIASSNTESEKAFLVTFVDGSKIRMRQELTSDSSALIDAIDNMYIEGGRTAILDAVLFATEYLAANGEIDGGPRSLVVITDGEDRSSSSTIHDVVEALKGAKIRVFSVALSDQKVVTKHLDKLAKETGGRAFYPRNRKEQGVIVEELIKLLRM